LEFGSLVCYRLLGFAGVSWFTSWLVCARVALATMFLFTAISHFAPMRRDLIAMVPRALPRPDLIVFATGIAEIAGAVGLLIPVTRLWAAWGLMALLMALLVALLPANISAARRGLLLRRRHATPLVLRVPIQGLFIVWAWSVR
jgi:uncharacterized membrane protein